MQRVWEHRHVSPIHVYLTTVAMDCLTYLIDSFLIDPVSWGICNLKFNIKKEPHEKFPLSLLPNLCPIQTSIHQGDKIVTPWVLIGCPYWLQQLSLALQHWCFPWRQFQQQQFSFHTWQHSQDLSHVLKQVWCIHLDDDLLLPIVFIQMRDSHKRQPYATQ